MIINVRDCDVCIVLRLNDDIRKRGEFNLRSKTTGIRLFFHVDTTWQSPLTWSFSTKAMNAVLSTSTGWPVLSTENSSLFYFCCFKKVYQVMYFTTVLTVDQG
jgi:hypothetical protein